MGFSRSNRSSEMGNVVEIVPRKPLAVRFASIVIVAVLAASFMPVTAFADEGSPDDTEGVQNPTTSSEGGQQNGQGENDENPQNPNDPIDSDNSDNPSDSDNSEAPDGNRPADDEPDSPSADNGSSEEEGSFEEDEDRGSLDSGDGTEHDELSDEESIGAEGESPQASQLAEPGYWWGFAAPECFSAEATSFSIEQCVTLEVTGVDVVYDNQFHSPRVTASDSGGHDVLIEYSVDNANWSGDIGTVSVRNVSDSKTIWVRASVPGVYEGYVVHSAEMKVNPREMTLISVDLQKEYDGEPLVNGLNAVLGKGFVGRDEGASYRFTGSQTEVGESPNSFEYTLNSRTKAENYTINLEFGTLRVTGPDTRPELVVRANSDTFLYSGKEISLDGFEQLSFRIQGETYTVSGLEAFGSGVEPGDYPVEITGTAVVTDGKGNDVTERFHVKTVNGTLRILDWNGDDTGASAQESE